MPVRPAMASQHMTTFAMLRTCQLMPSANAWTVNAGCLIWTPTKIAPAVAALMPAARVRLAVVMVMAGSSWSSWAGLSGVVEDGRKRHGESTSPSDVTAVVIGGCGLQQAEFGGAAHRGSAGVDVELGEDVLGVRPQRVDRYEQLLRDLRAGHF